MCIRDSFLHDGEAGNRPNNALDIYLQELGCESPLLVKLIMQSIYKMCIRDRAWKALSTANMAEYLRYMYKTVRKYYGEAIVVTQEVEDLSLIHIWIRAMTHPPVRTRADGCRKHRVQRKKRVFVRIRGC